MGKDSSEDILDDRFRREISGPHNNSDGTTIRVHLPAAVCAYIKSGSDILDMRRVDDNARRLHEHVAPPDFEPFESPITNDDIRLFGEGKHRRAFGFLGARAYSIDGIFGVLFATWAPGAKAISVVGDFNGWTENVHRMRRRNWGVWELFIPGLRPGALYKLAIESGDSGTVQLKADPYGQRFEPSPATATIVPQSNHVWGDKRWMESRSGEFSRRPLSIYEVHLGSWCRTDDGGFLNYRELAARLVPHIRELGFTHVELMPIAEHPFDGSWGYQSCGYFAPTSRFGTPDDFRALIDYLHVNDIGVVLDWVPGHFPKDAHGLARFDGTCLYEHADPRRGEHKAWDTLVFDYGRGEVRSFLISNAIYWLEEFHIDGLRVDAVASMLYLDYSRAPHEWCPNADGGNEHHEAVAFLRELNQAVAEEVPGAFTIAEESTRWEGVTAPAGAGGLGFSMKWNMGWMNDTLRYLEHDPLERKHHHRLLTFGMVYAFSENFVLALSHDEVVHLKRSLLEKMPGDEWQKFANLRLLYTYQFTCPGKKLLFMGGEFAQPDEWNHNRSLDWTLCAQPHHGGVKRLVADLNRLYARYPALHRFDWERRGVAWLHCDDADHSLLCYARLAEKDIVLVALNFTPVPRHGFRLGAPQPGNYQVVFNSDSRYYGGGDVGNSGVVCTEPAPAMGCSHSLCLSLPPLGGILLRRLDGENAPNPAVSDWPCSN